MDIKVSNTNLVPLSQKIVFGLGMLGNQMFPAALGVFMVVLVQGLGMSPILWGILAFAPRLFDAITDPIMGFITDNTRSRWGRRRPYIFIGAIIAGLSYILMWQVHPENSELYNFFYFLGFSLIFYLGMTIFSTPYVAMGYELSDNFHERTRVMAVAQWIGQWAWVIVPWFWVLIYDPEIFENSAAGARELSVWVGIFCLLLCITPAIFGKTKKAPDNLESLSRENFSKNTKILFKNLIETFRYSSFRKICITTFLIFNSFNTVAGFSWFIIVYYMNNGDAGQAGSWPAWFGTLSALSTCFLVIPIITFLSHKFGKKQAFIISQFVSLIGYALFFWCFQPENPYLMFLPLPLFAFGIGGLFTIMMSMTSDICDEDELASGHRREGMFGAVYWWMVKVGFAVAGLTGGIILTVVGFDQSAQQQSQEALEKLILAYILLPSTGTILSILIMSKYDLSEERANEIREQLMAKKGLKQ